MDGGSQRIPIVERIGLENRYLRLEERGKLR